MERRSYVAFYVILVAASAVFLAIERLTHLEFMFHLAAIPLEILLAVFIVQRFLNNRENEEKRRQLMLIKSCMFRSDMSNLFIANFDALESPPVTMSKIKDSTLNELKRIREQADTVQYKSLEMMEPVIMEYVKARHVWQDFMERAISYDFEDVFRDMVYILHFVHDVESFKENNPDRLFIREAQKNELLMRKVRKVLGDGIRKFLDYAIELKEKEPDLLYEIIAEYELVTETRAA